MIRNGNSIARRHARPAVHRLSLAEIFRGAYSTEAASPSRGSVSNSGSSSGSGSGRNETPKGHSGGQPPNKIPEVRTTEGAVNLFIFRLETFDPALPLVMRDSHQLPAMTKWFEPRGPHGTDHTFTPRLTKHSQTIFPYELTDPSASATAVPGQHPSLRSTLTEFRSWLIAHSNETYLPLMALMAALADPSTLSEDASSSPPHPADLQQQEFRQFYAPLGLLARACEFNATRSAYPRERLQRLYIAQSSLGSLPGDLAAEDLPTPALVRGAGKGDVYDSSVWLGLEPTYTPLHRDPNPNLFCQLLGEKRVRLLPPGKGQMLYERVRRELGSQGNSRFRGAEMMGGREMVALERAVWGDDGVGDGDGDGDKDGQLDMQQTVLRPGDTMFIPNGWWHSIRSNGAGALNASVNWWFR